MSEAYVYILFKYMHHHNVVEFLEFKTLEQVS